MAFSINSTVDHIIEFAKVTEEDKIKFQKQILEDTLEDELSSFADSDDSDYDEFDPYTKKKTRKQVERELVPEWCDQVKSGKKN